MATVVILYKGCKYRVSDKGKVFSFYTKRLMKGVDSSGYLYVMLGKKGQQKWFAIHKLVATNFCPRRKGRNIVNHLDGNKYNNCASNLRWSTQSENMKHAIRVLGIRDECRKRKCRPNGKVYKRHKRWVAIKWDSKKKKQMYLGSSLNKNTAIKILKEKASL